MNKILLLLLCVLGLSCSGTPKAAATTATADQKSDRVEVLSFHTKKRCPTCIAIEQLTREVVETDFAAQLADGSLVFRIADVSEEEALADKYEVTWSSLLVIGHKTGAESVNDLTKFAFANARTNPEKFKTELKAEIEKLLDE